MELDSAREVKMKAKAQIRVMLGGVQRQALGVRAQSLARFVQPPTLALGISRTEKGYILAVRVQHPLLRGGKVVETIRGLANGEVDVQYIGVIRKRQAPWYQQHCRPLGIGCSIGHVSVTAGTLGAFVKSRQDGSSMVLSNNHVLANENNAQVGDDILQPGKFDGGLDPADRVAALAKFISLDFQNPNQVDCAVASIIPGVQFNSGGLDTAGQLASVTPVAVSGNETVAKIGRTTGLTQGRVVAIEVDNVAVSYDNGQASFDGQIEIEGQGNAAFSQGGDSGSLIFDQNRNPVGLLFAGGDQGGSNNMGLTYANPLQGVLDSLGVDLLS